jgi:hypothetical protein
VYIGQFTPPNLVTTDRPRHSDFDSGKTRPRFFRDCPLFAAKIVLTRRIVGFSNSDPKRENQKENHAYIWQNPPPSSAPLISTRPVTLPPPPFLKPRRPDAVINAGDVVAGEGASHD